MNELEAIEVGFQNALSGLYRTLFESLVTHPGENTDKALGRFNKGLAAAREAKDLAISQISK